jgi:hypothetical protein
LRVLDANNFCHQISQLSQLTSPERPDQIKYIGQREESLQQIVSIPPEESLPQIVSSIYCHDAIHQIFLEQDICLGMKDSIDLERNAMDLYDQRDNKGQMLFNSVKEGFQNILDQLPEFSASIVLSNENLNILDKIFAQNRSRRSMCNCTCYPQLSNFSGMQSSFELYLLLTNMLR